MGIGPTRISKGLGVYKAYQNHVGNGPMPTDSSARWARPCAARLGVGATTGRPRRCGWFDAVAGRYSVRFDDLTSVALTRLDVLDSFPSIEVCRALPTRRRARHALPRRHPHRQPLSAVFEGLARLAAGHGGVRRFEVSRRRPRPASGAAGLIGCGIDLVWVGPERTRRSSSTPSSASRHRRGAGPAPWGLHLLGPSSRPSSRTSCRARRPTPGASATATTRWSTTPNSAATAA